MVQMVFEAIFGSSVPQKVIKFELKISENRGWLHGSFREVCGRRVGMRGSSLISMGSLLIIWTSKDDFSTPDPVLSLFTASSLIRISARTTQNSCWYGKALESSRLHRRLLAHQHGFPLDVFEHLKMIFNTWPGTGPVFRFYFDQNIC